SVPFGAPGAFVMELDNLSVNHNDVYSVHSNTYFDVIPGETYYVSAMAASTADANREFNLGMHFIDEAGTSQWVTVATWTPSEVWEEKGGIITVPAGKSRARLWMRTRGSGEGSPLGKWYASMFRMRKAVGSVIIEDG